MKEDIQSLRTAEEKYCRHIATFYFQNWYTARESKIKSQFLFTDKHKKNDNSLRQILEVEVKREKVDHLRQRRKKREWYASVAMDKNIIVFNMS